VPITGSNRISATHVSSMSRTLLLRPTKQDKKTQLSPTNRATHACVTYTKLLISTTSRVPLTEHSSSSRSSWVTCSRV